MPLLGAKTAIFAPAGGNLFGGVIMIRKTYDIDEDGVVLTEKEFKYSVFDSAKGYLFRAKNHFRKSYTDFKLSSVVKDRYDFLRVHLLAENIYKDTNTIMVRVNSRNVRTADIDDIADIIELSVKKTKEFISRMKKLHILAERIDTVGDTTSVKFVFNPLFFSSKKYISAELYFLFQESLDKHLPWWVIRKFHEVGNIKSE
jgi:hypothetical protein